MVTLVVQEHQVKVLQVVMAQQVLLAVVEVLLLLVRQDRQAAIPVQGVQAHQTALAALL